MVAAPVAVSARSSKPSRTLHHICIPRSMELWCCCGPSNGRPYAKSQPFLLGVPLRGTGTVGHDFLRNGAVRMAAGHGRAPTFCLHSLHRRLILAVQTRDTMLTRNCQLAYFSARRIDTPTFVSFTAGREPSLRRRRSPSITLSATIKTIWQMRVVSDAALTTRLNVVEPRLAIPAKTTVHQNPAAHGLPFR